jgi:hypothetical protein
MIIGGWVCPVACHLSSHALPYLPTYYSPHLKRASGLLIGTFHLEVHYPFVFQ